MLSHACCYCVLKAWKVEREYRLIGLHSNSSQPESTQHLKALSWLAQILSLFFFHLNPNIKCNRGQVIGDHIVINIKPIVVIVVSA